MMHISSNLIAIRIEICRIHRCSPFLFDINLCIYKRYLKLVFFSGFDVVYVPIIITQHARMTRKYNVTIKCRETFCLCRSTTERIEISMRVTVALNIVGNKLTSETNPLGGCHGRRCICHRHFLTFITMVINWLIHEIAWLILYEYSWIFLSRTTTLFTPTVFFLFCNGNNFTSDIYDDYMHTKEFIIFSPTVQ